MSPEQGSETSVKRYKRIVLEPGQEAPPGSIVVTTRTFKPVPLEEVFKKIDERYEDAFSASDLTSTSARSPRRKKPE